MGDDVERGFVLLAVAVVVAVVVASLAAPGSASPDDALAFDPGVPAEYAFDEPATPGVASVDGREFDSAQAAVDAAEPGDTVRLAGRFDGRIAVTTPNVTLTSAPGRLALVDGGETGDVLTIEADGVTVDRVWVRNSGRDTAGNDAGIWVNGTNATIRDSRVTAVTFGVWVDGVDDATIANNTIVGREAVRPLSYRGNGIQLWKTDGTFVADNRITDVRDGIYYSWSSHVLARGNAMWDLRYGVHYMYSDDNRLVNNTAFDNDVGYALMVSERLELVDNVAFNNSGTSGHGILLKSIDHTEIRDNHLVGNRRGLYVYNSLDNTIAGNLVLGNGVGVHLTAGSVEERVHGNSFVNNDRAVLAVVGELVTWNATDRGNYWSDARRADVDRDGVNEVRHRPAGLAEHLVQRHPQAAVFAASPAFDAVRTAESSFPVVETPGVIDYYPLADPPHDDWRRYYARD
ncbi:nitrous oxide reductase family maturation protein NosD [Halomarina halobia]|uniref:Nitrous oxide reductase family maturation protein NosD n=1 Tax=Halomarina halobia TaxID=3033386 RepID=A0ABD6A7M1_9EURY|nr:nitrous oxide reductase family maturation protein NosD [Halomarina sp. PSR21]